MPQDAAAFSPPARRLKPRCTPLGVDSLERTVRCEPLLRAHDCVFAVLAMEREPVNPRL
ncbi:MAG: hypothetical protein GC172_09830 [Phycisphaera sp.]|nr:hypothetical protein [Phycisphaera sp.]